MKGGLGEVQVMVEVKVRIRVLGLVVGLVVDEEAQEVVGIGDPEVEAEDGGVGVIWHMAIVF